MQFTFTKMLKMIAWNVALSSKLTGFLPNELQNLQNFHKILHSTDLVLTYSTETDPLIIFPYNPVLLDHSLVTLKFKYTASERKFRNTRYLSEDAVAKFKETKLLLISSLYTVTE